MTEHPVIHNTFVIKRTFPAPVSRVFTAFTTREARDAWGDTGDLDATEPDADSGDSEFDFRVGGHERFSVGMQGTSFRYDATYYDIVPEQRIIYCYEMYADGVRSSVSIATIEFVTVDGGTALMWTEQGAYLNGIDGAEAPYLRRGGTSEMLDGLAKYLG
ncbi:MAG TPA: SRPBCC domain-containing protein [Ktedonobacteraceae bacterium]|jgi:uncharacterized protein YndB with AHSA1/START domain